MISYPTLHRKNCTLRKRSMWTNRIRFWICLWI